MKEIDGTIHTVLRMMALVALCGMSASCCRNHIPDPSELECQLDVRFDWRNDTTFRPDGMTVIFSPVCGEDFRWRFDIPGYKGGSVELPCGRYDMLFYNNDTSRILFRDDPSQGIVASIETDDNSLRQPDMLYSGMTSGLRVTPWGTGISPSDPDGDSEDRGFVRCFPHRRTRIYSVIVTDIENIGDVAEVTGTMTGLAPGIRISDGLPVGEGMEMQFPMSGRPDKNEISGRFFNFGPSDGSENRLVMGIRLKNGRTFEASYLITKHIVNSNTSLDVLIILKDLVIPHTDDPDVPIGDGGIQAGVGGWEIVETDITV